MAIGFYEIGHASDSLRAWQNTEEDAPAPRAKEIAKLMADAIAQEDQDLGDLPHAEVLARLAARLNALYTELGMRRAESVITIIGFTAVELARRTGGTGES
jgi:hypothetical protein